MKCSSDSTDLTVAIETGVVKSGDTLYIIFLNRREKYMKYDMKPSC